MSEKNPRQEKQSVIDQLPVDWNTYETEHPETLACVEKSRAVDDERLRGLDEGVHDLPTRASLPGYLGSGWEKAAYGQGEHVVKVLNKEGVDDKVHYVSPFEAQVEPLIRGADIEGVEQIVTANPDLGVIVTERAPGLPVGEIPSTTLLRKVTSEHVANLRKTLEDLREQRLEADNVANVLFDPEAGFTVIDYRGIERFSHDKPPTDEELDDFVGDILSLKKKDVAKNTYNHLGEKQTRYGRTLGGLAVRLAHRNR